MQCCFTAGMHCLHHICSKHWSLPDVPLGQPLVLPSTAIFWAKRDICLYGCSYGLQRSSVMRSWAAQGGRSVLHLPLPLHSSTTPSAKQLLDWKGKLLKPLQANPPHDTCQSPYFKIPLSNLFWNQIPFYYFFLSNSVAWGMLLVSEVVHGIKRTQKIPSYGQESTCRQAKVKRLWEENFETAEVRLWLKVLKRKLEMRMLQTTVSLKG